MSSDPAAASMAAAAGPPRLPPMVQVGSPYGGRGPAFLGVAWSGSIIATALIVGRLYLRFKKSRAERMHDMSLWLALISWACAIAGTSLLTVAVAHGFGNHISNLSLPNIITATKYLWLGISLATFSTGTSKAAVAAFLLAMQGQSTYHKNGAYFLYFMGVTNILLNFLAMFTIIYQCNPPSAAWDPRITDADCYDREHLFGPVALTHASWTAFSDFALAIYPIYIVYKLQIAIGIKVYLCIIMGLGLVGSAFSFVKLHLLDDLVKHKPSDPMFQVPILAIWGWAELWLVLLALSVPPIWPLLKPCLQNMPSLSRKHTVGYRHAGKRSHGYLASSSSHDSAARHGIKETKDVIVLTEAHSTKSLCSVRVREEFMV